MLNSIPVFLFYACYVSFTGYALYSPFYFYFRWKNPGKALRRWDADATTLVLTAGLFYLPLWATEAMDVLNGMPDKTFNEHYEGAVSDTGYFYWGAPIFYFVVSQFLWIRKVKEWIVTRLLVSAAFLIAPFYLLGRASELKRTNWPLDIRFVFSNTIFVDYLVKAFLFTCALTIVYFLRNRGKKL